MDLISLDEFLLDYPQISLARKKDNEDILEFYRKLDMENSNQSIKYDRTPNFFKFLEYSYGEYFVLLLKNKKNEIAGIGTVIKRKLHLNGVLEDVCYLGDLRVNSLRYTILWRSFYAEFMKKMTSIKEFSSVKVNYTVVLAENLKAMKALSSHKNKFYYHLKANYKMVNIIAPSFLVKQSHQVEMFEFSDMENQFLEREMNNHYLMISQEELRFRFANFYDEKRLYKVLKDGEIVAVFGLWSPQDSKTIEIGHLSSLIRWFYNFSKIGFSAPKLNKKLKPLYLNNLIFKKDMNVKERSLILSSIIRYTFHSNKMDHYHFLTMADFEDESLYDGYKWCYHQTVGAKLFEVSKVQEGLIHDSSSYLSLDLSLI